MRREKTMPEPKQVYGELLEVMKARRGGYAGMDIPEFPPVRLNTGPTGTAVENIDFRG
jgi:hypothetical protein